MVSWSLVRWLLSGMLTTLFSGAGFLFFSLAIEYAKAYNRAKAEAKEKRINASMYNGIPVWSPDGALVGRQLARRRCGGINRRTTLFEAYRRSSVFLGNSYYRRPGHSSRMDGFQQQSSSACCLEGYYSQCVESMGMPPLLDGTGTLNSYEQEIFIERPLTQTQRLARQKRRRANLNPRYLNAADSALVLSDGEVERQVVFCDECHRHLTRSAIIRRAIKPSASDEGEMATNRTSAAIMQVRHDLQQSLASEPSFGSVTSVDHTQKSIRGRHQEDGCKYTKNVSGELTYDTDTISRRDDEEGPRDADTRGNVGRIAARRRPFHRAASLSQLGSRSSRDILGITAIEHPEKKMAEFSGTTNFQRSKSNPEKFFRHSSIMTHQRTKAKGIKFKSTDRQHGERGEANTMGSFDASDKVMRSRQYVTQSPVTQERSVVRKSPLKNSKRRKRSPKKIGKNLRRSPSSKNKGRKPSKGIFEQSNADQPDSDKETINVVPKLSHDGDSTLLPDGMSPIEEITVKGDHEAPLSTTPSQEDAKLPGKPHGCYLEEVLLGNATPPNDTEKKPQADTKRSGAVSHNRNTINDEKCVARKPPTKAFADQGKSSPRNERFIGPNKIPKGNKKTKLMENTKRPGFASPRPPLNDRRQNPVKKTVPTDLHGRDKSPKKKAAYPDPPCRDKSPKKKAGYSGSNLKNPPRNKPLSPAKPKAPTPQHKTPLWGGRPSPTRRSKSPKCKSVARRGHPGPYRSATNGYVDGHEEKCLLRESRLDAVVREMERKRDALKFDEYPIGAEITKLNSPTSLASQDDILLEKPGGALVIGFSSKSSADQKTASSSNISMFGIKDFLSFVGFGQEGAAKD